MIGPECVDVMDRSCVRVCPVDCIYEGARKLYINPEECIDCAACEAECPVQAIYFDEDVPEELSWAVADNAAFFTEVLPGRAAPLGSPGGAREVGPVGADTPRVAGLPRAADG
ncbi:ferredoxin [Thermocatellispora tengchongensis]|uniref:ferredoxin n=1 Tax=Thermocatellispora tengchongensis TaxID=1073253 RepID=UPI00362E5973